MNLYHTSPVKITEIHDRGLFGSFLCFSSHVYQMCPGDVNVYEIELSDAEIIDAGVLFIRDQDGKLDGIVNAVMSRFSVDEETATDLLSEKRALHIVLPESDADDSWWIQKKTAQCAAKLGYIACRMTDEQGCVYFVDANNCTVRAALFN